MDQVIQKYLKEGSIDQARDLITAGAVPAEVARRLAQLQPIDRATVFSKFDRREAIAAFLHLDDDEQASLLEAMGLTRASIFAAHLPVSVIARASELLPREFSREFMNGLPAQKREGIRAILGHPADSVARVMRGDFVRFEGTETVEGALARLRRNGNVDDEVGAVCFVINSAGKYLGHVPLAGVLRADPKSELANLVQRGSHVVGMDDNKVDAARLLQRVNLPVLPVVDKANHLVGVLRFDDAMDVLDEDVSEDVYKQAGVGSLIHSTEVVRSEKLTAGSIGYPVRVRLTFLLVTLAGGLMVGGLIDHFEDVLAAVIAVAIFIPLIMDMGGNVGTQSTTIFARGLALGHINLDRFVKVHLLRELRVGIAMATIIGLVAGTIAYFWQGLPNEIPLLGVAVGVALFFSVVTASLLGFLLPFIMLKLGIDHAPGADPFITTIKDFSGLAVYFLLVASLLGVGA